MYDVIIIGAGPAGMTAAVYAARKKMRTLLITAEFGGQVMRTLGIENYMGYQYITGPELMEKFQEQVRKYELDQEEGRVVQLEKELIERINYLSRKQRDDGLNKEEQAEQAQLRQVYLACIKSRVKDTLDRVQIVDEPTEPQNPCDCGCDGKHKH